MDVMIILIRHLKQTHLLFTITVNHHLKQEKEMLEQKAM